MVWTLLVCSLLRKLGNVFLELRHVKMQEDVKGLATFGVLTQNKHDGSVLSSPKCITKLSDKYRSLLACTQQGNAVAAVCLDKTVLHRSLKETIQISKVSMKIDWFFLCLLSKGSFLSLGDALRDTCKGRHPSVCTQAIIHPLWSPLRSSAELSQDVPSCLLPAWPLLTLYEHRGIVQKEFRYFPTSELHEIRMARGVYSKPQKIITSIMVIETVVRATTVQLLCWGC